MEQVLTAPVGPQVISKPSKTHRIGSIDLLRGIIMIIMALDHVRDYFHADAFLYSPTDLSRTTVVLFFTRWITHFCAPVFMFLAGTSAFLVGQRKTKAELSSFLLKRGIWLMFLDLVIVYFGWSFDISFHIFLFNVIWVFGVSMIVLATLIHLPIKIILVIGLVMVVGHNALDNVSVEGNTLPAFLWAVLHQQAAFTFGGRTFFVSYPLIPWVGVMALGYCLGSLYTNRYEATTRKKILIIIGSMAILLFIGLRAVNIYGDSSRWSYQSSGLFTFLSFINPSKYPPSLFFLLMTLGPALLFLAFTEKTSGRLVKVISVYGRVPLFFYVIHIYVIHLLAMLAAGFSPGFSWSDMIFNKELLWFTGKLKGYGFSLGIVYAIWALLIVILYFLCKWYDKYKSAHKEKWWLSYL